MVTRREGVSPDKLHFRISEIATWRVEMPHLQIHKMQIREKHFKHKRLVLAMVILGKLYIHGIEKRSSCCLSWSLLWLLFLKVIHV
jgi:hypothetical protein